MSFLQIYLNALLIILVMMSLLWVASVILKNAGIVDIFWGTGFLIATTYYFLASDGDNLRRLILLICVALWSLRLSVYIAWRNAGKGEDYRYRQFRKNYGEHRYWWISYFQVFLLQGLLMWLISAPLLAAQYYGTEKSFGIIDIIAGAVWIIGFVFEAGGDYQLAVFKANPANRGKVLNYGFWKYTRHPNYFGDAAVWWSYGLFSIAAGSWLPVLGPVLMTFLIIRISGVSLLEKNLTGTKPEYIKYKSTTSAFLPWFPGKKEEGISSASSS
jgi:steroid 5-alpha reductase family enzyme